MIRMFFSIVFLLISISCYNPPTVSGIRTNTDSNQAPTGSNTQIQVESNNQGQPETKTFYGKMRGHFQMTLTKEGENLTGSYSLMDDSSKTVTEFKLTGKIDTGGKFVLAETDAQGAITDEISGTWINDESDDTAYIYLKSPTKKDVYGDAILAREQKIFFSGPAKFRTESFDRVFGKFILTSGDYPVLSGVTKADKFNRAVKSLVDRQVNDFRKDSKDAEREQQESDLWISYNVEHADENIISIGFEGKTMYEGAAHSNEHNFTLNYDLKSGREIKLTDLFKPKSDYLQRITASCLQKLRVCGNGWSGEMNPKKGDTRTWSLTRRGLLIKFDPYEVDAYAAGTVNVIIPFSELKDVMRNNNPANRMIK